MSTGRAIYDLVRRLYPICRSITGDGVRTTLRLLREVAPLEIREVPSGTRVFDWRVPPEWNVRAAFVETPAGERLVDFAEHNLHLVGYSVPVDAVIPRDELLARLHSLPDRPGWIPYRTSYYRPDWGFCIRHEDRGRFRASEYRVRIESTLAPGGLSYGELYLPGRRREEVLIYTHVCHPSLCNDNLSGIAVTAYLAAALGARARRFSYRFVWAPGTIGAITWLAVNEDAVARIEHGLVAALLGDSGRFHYKRSRRGNAEMDRIGAYAVARRGGRVLPFEPYGYDERQFCSPGFDLPMGRLTRTPNGAYAEYHTSADDLRFVSAESLEESYGLLCEIVDLVESNRKYVNLSPRCEPQLGRRGLYRHAGGTQLPERESALLWMLSLSDGSHSLLDIAERSSLPPASLAGASEDLVAAGLLAPTEPG